MVESVFCVALVGGLVVVSLDTLGASTTAQRHAGDRALGLLLASSAMSEIMNQSYEEIALTAASGIEVLGIRLAQPYLEDEEVYNEWQQSVQVEMVNPADLSNERFLSTGVKRITVTVTRHGIVMAALVAVKTGDNQGGVLAID